MRAETLIAQYQEGKRSFSQISLPHGADLRGAKLTRADLRRADLREANLPGAKLRGADLSGAEYDDKTKWPAGFDPEAADAILK